MSNIRLCLSARRPLRTSHSCFSKKTQILETINGHEQRFCSVASCLSTQAPPRVPPPLHPPPNIFVPNHSSPCAESVNRLVDLLSSSRRLLVMTGAGISTESGIPDYRSEGVGEISGIAELSFTICKMGGSYDEKNIVAVLIVFHL